jgi:cold shock protein
MATGLVKWFNDAKGFGFVTPDGGGADIFIHFSSIAMEGYKTLKQGSRVRFELVQGPKGLNAQNIQTESFVEQAAPSPAAPKRESHVRTPQFHAAQMQHSYAMNK